MKAIAASLLILALIGATGCRTRPPVNRYAQGMQPGVVMDTGLAEDLTVDAVVRSQVGELPQIQTIVSNRTKKQIAYEYYVEWYDSRGMVIASPMTRWQIKHIYGGDAQPLTAVAPRPDALTWVLKLKRRP